MATKTIFDHLSGILDKKIPWEELSESDRKTFSVYMVNRFLSMSPDFIEFVDQLQRYTLSVLDPREVYKLYLDVLPKKKLFLKYIKNKSEDKYDKKLINIIAKHYECSIKEATEYLDIFNKNKINQESLLSILVGYGLEEKEIKKLI